MIRRAAPMAVALAALSGCGPSLGSYEVTDVRLVNAVPDTEDSAMLGRGEEYGPFVRVEVRSEFDLIAEGNGNIYADKIGCGIFDDDTHMIFGPLAADDPPVELFDVEHAMRRDQAGFARYYLYLPVSSPTWQSHSTGPIQPGYDLRVDPDDLCLKIFQAGYFITESRSDTIRVPRETLTEALKP